jgi:peptidoglycan hydrolase CwlO-like protein
VLSGLWVEVVALVVGPINALEHVSVELRNAAQAQQGCWQQSVEAEVAGNEAEAEGARALAGLLGTEQTRLEKAREAYEDWEGRTVQARDSAAKARKELERRGTLEEVTAEPAESTAAWYAEFSAQADAVEAAIGRERKATAEAGTPWPPGARGARARASGPRGPQS